MGVLTSIERLASSVKSMRDIWFGVSGIKCAALDDLWQSVKAYSFGELDIMLRKLSVEMDEADKMPDEYKNKLLSDIKETAALQEGVATIGAETFYESNVIYIKAKPCEPSLSKAFYNCYSLQLIEPLPLTEDVTTMSYAFYGCESLRRYDGAADTMKGVTSLSQAFYGCSSLSELTFPEGSLGANISFFEAFIRCSKLTKVDMSKCAAFATSKNCDVREMFRYCTKLETVIFPEGSMKTVTDLNCMFDQDIALTSISFPEESLSNVTSLSYAFRGCSSLPSLVFPEGSLQKVTILAYAFSSCSSLTELIFPEESLSNVTSLSYAFQGCSSMTSFSFPEGAFQSVGSMYAAFYGCLVVTDITFPESMVFTGTDMGTAFQNCKVITSIALPKCTKPIQSLYWTFAAASRLEEVVFPDGFTLTDTANLCSTFSGTQIPVIDIAYMGAPKYFVNTFYHSGAISINIDMSNAEGYNTLDMRTFRLCTKLETVNLVSTAKLQNFYLMFEQDSSLKTITGLDFSSVVLTQAGVKEYYTSCLESNLATAFASAVGLSMFYKCDALTSCVISGTIYRSGLSTKFCPQLDAPSLYSFVVALYDWETNAEAKETDDADHIFYMTAAQQATLSSYAGELNDEGDMVSGADVIDRAIEYGWTLTA